MKYKRKTDRVPKTFLIKMVGKPFLFIFIGILRVAAISLISSLNKPLMALWISLLKQAKILDTLLPSTTLTINQIE